MNLKETLELIAALKDAGATHFKSSDFEVSLNPKRDSLENSHTQDRTHTSENEGRSVPLPLPNLEPTKENVEATDKLKGLINTLKLNDTDLVDQIFPNGAES